MSLELPKTINETLYSYLIGGPDNNVEGALDSLYQLYSGYRMIRQANGVNPFYGNLALFEFYQKLGEENFANASFLFIDEKSPDPEEINNFLNYNKIFQREKFTDIIPELKRYIELDYGPLPSRHSDIIRRMHILLKLRSKAEQNILSKVMGIFLNIENLKEIKDKQVKIDEPSATVIKDKIQQLLEESHQAGDPELAGITAKALLLDLTARNNLEKIPRFSVYTINHFTERNDSNR